MICNCGCRMEFVTVYPVYANGPRPTETPQPPKDEAWFGVPRSSQYVTGRPRTGEVGALDRAVMESLLTIGAGTIQELADRLNTHPSSARKALKRLANRGAVFSEAGYQNRKGPVAKVFRVRV